MRYLRLRKISRRYLRKKHPWNPVGLLEKVLERVTATCPAYHRCTLRGSLRIAAPPSRHLDNRTQGLRGSGVPHDSSVETAALPKSGRQNERDHQMTLAFTTDKVMKPNAKEARITLRWGKGWP